MSVDAKKIAQDVLDAAAEKGVNVVLPQLAELLAGLFHIGVDAAKKGETALANKAGVADPGVQA
jgi:hypothetical protein